MGNSVDQTHCILPLSYSVTFAAEPMRRNSKRSHRFGLRFAQSLYHTACFLSFSPDKKPVIDIPFRFCYPLCRIKKTLFVFVRLELKR